MKKSKYGRVIMACSLGLLLATPFVDGQVTVNSAGALDNGLGLENGIDLPDNSLLRFGYFSTLSDAQITLNAGSFAGVSNLNADFVEFAFGFIGDGFGNLDAHWSLALAAPVSTFAGKRIYLWAFDATSTNILASGAFQEHGIFYSTNSNWVFPSDLGDTTIELSDLSDASGTNLASGARILYGSFGTGTSDVYGSPLFNLEAVPEPSTYLMLGLGLGVIAIARRRKS